MSEAENTMTFSRSDSEAWPRSAARPSGPAIRRPAPKGQERVR